MLILVKEITEYLNEMTVEDPPLFQPNFWIPFQMPWPRDNPFHTMSTAQVKQIKVELIFIYYSHPFHRRDCATEAPYRASVPLAEFSAPSWSSQTAQGTRRRERRGRRAAPVTTPVGTTGLNTLSMISSLHLLLRIWTQRMRVSVEIFYNVPRKGSSFWATFFER